MKKMHRFHILFFFPTVQLHAFTLLKQQLLARLHEVERAIVVNTVVHVSVPWHSFPVTLRLCFLEVHILTTTCQKAFILAL